MNKSLLLKPTLFAAIIACFCPESSHAQGKTYWWNDAVFYEIFVRSFYDSNGNGNGDLRGLIQKLDYLNDGDPATTSDLGVTGIWLMPISQSPSYHGYDVTDYRSIEQDYGTLSDFHALIDSAHARGIKVIIDLVLNHSSNFHPWFIQSAASLNSPYRDWYIWRDQNPGYKGPWGQEVWHLRNGAYYFGIFWSGMPDINYANQDAKNEMFETARFWLNTMKADGFRLDAIKHLFEDGPIMENVPATFEFLKEFRQFYKNVNASAVTVGEVWSSTNEIVPYADGTKVDFCFEFPISYAIINAVNAGRPNEIMSQMQAVIPSYPYLQYAPFLTNHDQDRVFDQFGQNLNKMKLAAAVYLTLPGIPFMYYGEEIGMIGNGPDENKRTPMQWTDDANAGFTTGTPWYPLNANYIDFNVRKMQADNASLWHWYRTLIAARTQHEALRRGDYAAMNSDNGDLYAYARRSDREVLIVWHNFRNQPLDNFSLTLGESKVKPGSHAVQEILSGNRVGTVLIENDGGFTNWRPNLELPAQGTAILKIDLAALPPGLPFADNFEADQDWSIFEEMVDSTCYADSIGEVTRSMDFSNSSSNSLRIWANKKGEAKSNHVLGRLKLSDEGLTGHYIYSVDAYIPATSDTGQTGPEFSVQSTRNVSGTNLTYVAGIQFVGNPYVDQGTRWQVWHDGSWTRFLNHALAKGQWYHFELEMDFERNTYVRFGMQGAGTSVELDLSTYTIKGEMRNFQPATEITLAGENLETCLRPRPTQFKIYYDNVKLGSALVNVTQTPNLPPFDFRLSQNYPNPFNPTTVIEYNLHQSGFVILEIFTSQGQKAKTLVREKQTAGNYQALWEGTNDAKQKVSSGAYLCRLKVNGQEKSIRMIFVK